MPAGKPMASGGVADQAGGGRLTGPRPVGGRRCMEWDQRGLVGAVL